MRVSIPDKQCSAFQNPSPSPAIRSKLRRHGHLNLPPGRRIIVRRPPCGHTGKAVVAFVANIVGAHREGIERPLPARGDIEQRVATEQWCAVGVVAGEMAWPGVLTIEIELQCVVGLP